ncbi:hypothetical protein R84B8_01827 [Treponema sp. R8-4-B8]
MTVQEMEALDINRQNYIKVFELSRIYKKSFIKIEIKQFNDDFFYGLHYLFKDYSLYNERSRAALRKWGTYTSLVECKEAAIKEVKKAAKSEIEKNIVKNFKF